MMPSVYLILGVVQCGAFLILEFTYITAVVYMEGMFFLLILTI